MFGPDLISRSSIWKYKSTIILKESSIRLHNAWTDWDKFRIILEEGINLKIPLKTEEELNNSVEYFTNTIQSAAWQCTPHRKRKENVSSILNKLRA
jgi:hypothetical protein